MNVVLKNVKTETSVKKHPHRYRDVHPSRKGIVLAWLGFTVTFGGLRLLTWLIHIHVEGLGNVTAGGLHLHHYLYGILLLVVISIFGLFDRKPKQYAWMGVFLGVGLALIVDEAALLIELKDVYWTGTGGISIAIALSLIGLVGCALAIAFSPLADDDK